MSVWKIYKSLDAEQKRILSEKVIDLNRPPDEILRTLKPLAACDALGDKARSRLGCSGAIAIVIMVVFFIAWAATTNMLMAIPAAIALVAAIFLLWLWSWTKKIDLSNNFRQFVLPVLTMFREDFAAGQPVHVKLDLRPPTSPPKKTGESEPYKHGVYYKVVDSTYVDSWMSAEGALSDGSKLSWSITDYIRERKKTKRNPRGKIKSKTKYSKKSYIEVDLGLRKKLYEVAPPPGAEIDSGAKRNSVRVARTVRSASIDPLDPRALIDLVADIYRNARPVKKEA